MLLSQIAIRIQIWLLGLIVSSGIDFTGVEVVGSWGKVILFPQPNAILKREIL